MKTYVTKSNKKPLKYRGGLAQEREATAKQLNYLHCEPQEHFKWQLIEKEIESYKPVQFTSNISTVLMQIQFNNKYMDYPLFSVFL